MKYDVVVIGGGPAGMAAALSAEREGAKVLLLETDSLLGGILNQCIHSGFGLHIFKEELTGPEYAARFRERIEHSSVEVMLNTLVLEVSSKRQVIAVSKELGLCHIEAGAVVFATGCRERSRGAIQIPGTRPAGVLTAGAAQKYVNIYGYMVGKECVILGSGDIGLIMARRMTFEGAKVKAVVELMPYSSGLSRNIVQCLEDYDIPLLLSHTVVNIHGKQRISGVTIAKVDDQRRPSPGTEQFISCDTLLLSVGLVPETQLALGAGTEVTGSYVTVNQHFETSVPGIFICGNTLHVHDLVDYVTQESEIAGGYAARFALHVSPTDVEKQESEKEIAILPQQGISYTVPQKLVGQVEKDVALRFRTNRVYQRVAVVVRDDEKELGRIKKRVMAPGEMQTISLKQSWAQQAVGNLTIGIEEEVL